MIMQLIFGSFDRELFEGWCSKFGYSILEWLWIFPLLIASSSINYNMQGSYYIINFRK